MRQVVFGGPVRSSFSARNDATATATGCLIRQFIKKPDQDQKRPHRPVFLGPGPVQDRFGTGFDDNRSFPWLGPVAPCCSFNIKKELGNLVKN